MATGSLPQIERFEITLNTDTVLAEVRTWWYTQTPDGVLSASAVTINVDPSDENDFVTMFKGHYDEVKTAWEDAPYELEFPEADPLLRHGFQEVAE